MRVAVQGTLHTTMQVPNDVKMAKNYIISCLLILAFISDVRTQYFDFFGFQPIAQQFQTRPTPKYTDYNRRIEDHSTKRFNQDDSEREINKQTTQKAIRRKTTTASLFNFNFFSTTPKPMRKATKSSQRITSSTRKITRPNSKETTRINNNNRRLESSVYNVDNKQQSDWYEKPIISNIADDYYNVRPEITTKRQTYEQSRPNNNQDYNNNNQNYNNNNQNYNTNNQYTTKNPFYNRPGVKPPIVNNGPPITNRPVTKRPRPVTHSPVIINPSPTNAGAIVFPKDDVSPEMITGPDEDYMSQAEKRRHIEMAEKMCDKYKSLNTKKIQAIPLVPSPEPVQINVSNCAPTTIPLVVGGKVVSINEFPHMALLGWLKLEGGGYSWKCGGSLLSDRYVLTAGHCAYQERDNTVVTGPPRAVQLGSSYLDDPGALVARVSAVVRHPKYKFPKSYYDLALLKLTAPVTFSEVIRPACLGVPPPVGDPIIATGWGRTEFGGDQSLELRSVSLPVWDMSECWSVLGTSRRMPEGPSSDSQMCAGVKEGGKDTCQGDSGGPAQIQDGCLWRVVAVTSLGRSCGAPRTPGLYSIAHRVFIAAQIFGDQRNTNKNQQTTTTSINRQPNTNNNQGINSGNDYNINNNQNQQTTRTPLRQPNVNNNHRTNSGNDYNSNNNDYNNNNYNQQTTRAPLREPNVNNNNGPNSGSGYNSNNNDYNNNNYNRQPTHEPVRQQNVDNSHRTNHRNVNVEQIGIDDGYNSYSNINRRSDPVYNYNSQNNRDNSNYGSDNGRLTDSSNSGRVWWT